MTSYSDLYYGIVSRKKAVSKQVFSHIYLIQSCSNFWRQHWLELLSSTNCGFSLMFLSFGCLLQQPSQRIGDVVDGPAPGKSYGKKSLVTSKKDGKKVHGGGMGGWGVDSGCDNWDPCCNDV